MKLKSLMLLTFVPFGQTLQYQQQSSVHMLTATSLSSFHDSQGRALMRRGACYGKCSNSKQDTTTDQTSPLPSGPPGGPPGRPLAHSKRPLQQYPTSVSVRTRGPARVDGWAGKKGSKAPYVPAGKTMTMNIVHPESAMLRIDHHGPYAASHAFAAGKETRVSSIRPQNQVTGSHDVAVKKGRGSFRCNSPSEHVKMAMSTSDHLAHPSYCMGELNGMGSMHVLAENISPYPGSESN